MAESVHLVPQRDHSPDTVRFLAALARTTTTATKRPLVAVWQVAPDGRLARHWDFDTAPLSARQRGDGAEGTATRRAVDIDEPFDAPSPRA